MTTQPYLSRATQSYADLSALQALKRPSLDKQASLEAVARQFESLLTAQMLQAMRSANRVLAKDNPLNTWSTQFYEDMFDQQLAVSLSTGKGLGLARLLVQQLGGDSSWPTRYANLEDYRKHPVDRPLTQVEERMLQEMDGILASVTHPNDGDTHARTDIRHPEDSQGGPVASSSRSPDAGRADQAFDSPEDFVTRLAPAARRVADELGVDYRVLLAQAALETGWGRHMIRDEAGGNSFNLFGIKAGEGWTGRTAWTQTTEYVGGKPIKISAPFRAYDSFEDSFRDYLQFLRGNARYAPALEQAADPQAYTKALQEAGYATDPAYSRKILGILGRLREPGAAVGGEES